MFKSARKAVVVVPLLLAMVLMGAGSAGAQDPAAVPAPEPAPNPHGLPADSGHGRRIVYSVEQQRVWWVESDGNVVRTYLVSGRAGTPRPGTYSVYSRSRHTTPLSGRGRMEFMIRFTRGAGGNAIGFHSIPLNSRGRPIQSDAQLGTPLSAGCIRQNYDDAMGLWNWAPVGTTVVVVK